MPYIYRRAVHDKTVGRWPYQSRRSNRGAVSLLQGSEGRDLLVDTQCFREGSDYRLPGPYAEVSGITRGRLRPSISSTSEPSPRSSCTRRTSDSPHTRGDAGRSDSEECPSASPDRNGIRRISVAFRVPCERPVKRNSRQDVLAHTLDGRRRSGHYATENDREYRYRGRRTSHSSHYARPVAAEDPPDYSNAYPRHRRSHYLKHPARSRRALTPTSESAVFSRKGWDALTTLFWDRLPKRTDGGTRGLAGGLTGLLGIDSSTPNASELLPRNEPETRPESSNQAIRLQPTRDTDTGYLSSQPYALPDGHTGNTAVSTPERSEVLLTRVAALTDEVNQLRALLNASQRTYQEEREAMQEQLYKASRDRTALLERLSIVNEEREQQELVISDIGVKLDETSRQLVLAKSEIFHYKHLLRRAQAVSFASDPVSDAAVLSTTTQPFSAYQVIPDGTTYPVTLQLTTSSTGRRILCVVTTENQTTIDLSNVLQMDIVPVDHGQKTRLQLLTSQTGLLQFELCDELSVQQCLYLFRLIGRPLPSQSPAQSRSRELNDLMVEQQLQSFLLGDLRPPQLSTFSSASGDHRSCAVAYPHMHPTSTTPGLNYPAFLSNGPPRQASVAPPFPTRSLRPSSLSHATHSSASPYINRPSSILVHTPSSRARHRQYSGSRDPRRRRSRRSSRNGDSSDANPYPGCCPQTPRRYRPPQRTSHTDEESNLNNLLWRLKQKAAAVRAKTHHATRHHEPRANSLDQRPPFKVREIEEISVSSSDAAVAARGTPVRGNQVPSERPNKHREHPSDKLGCSQRAYATYERQQGTPPNTKNLHYGRSTRQAPGVNRMSNHDIRAAPGEERTPCWPARLEVALAEPLKVLENELLNEVASYDSCSSSSHASIVRDTSPAEGDSVVVGLNILEETSEPVQTPRRETASPQTTNQCGDTVTVQEKGAETTASVIADSYDWLKPGKSSEDASDSSSPCPSLPRSISTSEDGDTLTLLEVHKDVNNKTNGKQKHLSSRITPAARGLRVKGAMLSRRRKPSNRRRQSNKLNTEGVRPPVLNGMSLKSAHVPESKETVTGYIESIRDLLEDSGTCS